MKLKYVIVHIATSLFGITLHIYSLCRESLTVTIRFKNIRKKKSFFADHHHSIFIWLKNLTYCCSIQRPVTNDFFERMGITALLFFCWFSFTPPTEYFLIQIPTAFTINASSAFTYSSSYTHGVNIIIFCAPVCNRGSTGRKVNLMPLLWFAWSVSVTKQKGCYTWLKCLIKQRLALLAAVIQQSKEIRFIIHTHYLHTHWQAVGMPLSLAGGAVTEQSFDLPGIELMAVINAKDYLTMKGYSK